ncbi:PDZ domain-containing protein GIPC1, putative [Pediculus humanus corporis]|uniref:PDZ domain-containing protein GIPC1, putative n=1 Tax=Pediculus humanus subsp. corporis TaxID=121224 RepID=E0VAX5_PEDHC|nr:PDZ domain-containing protein GIPC1, putative [Pediculus humanus corporis]EEB10531.1 PDZ domain-containing protein GIPC1, putative [Pediculus humanus corporis]
MPFFPKKHNNKDDSASKCIINDNNYNHNRINHMEPSIEDDDRQTPVFYCQQAQGSPTGIISGFNNVKELYQKISECYDFEPNEILFCTLNTHKINMNKLLGAQIALTDFIFIHRKGRAKEVELIKKEESLGLTITDNGNGLAFIKRIKPGSVIEQIPVIQVGDHIEKINDESLIGKRHFEVAKRLKDIPQGSTFTLRLVSPLQAGFYNIGPREDKGRGRKSNYGSGKETLRFKAGGAAVVEVVDDSIKYQKAVDGINELLESYLGINDSELAGRIWEISDGIKNSLDFLMELNNSDLSELGFSDGFIFELWGVITDARDGRI